MGATYPLSTLVTDDSGAPIAATGVVVTVTLPDLTTATPAVTNPVLGTYSAYYPTTQGGRHVARWTGAIGANTLAIEEVFDVIPVVRTALAFPTDLGAFLRETIDPLDQTALLVLDIATGMVRDHLELNGYALDAVTADVVLLDPVAGGIVLFLEGLPVTAVTLVETFDGTVWTTVAPANYSVSKRLGMISALPYTGVTWPSDPETWRVTYNHGFTVLPSSIFGVVLGVAARAWANPGGAVAAETFGPHMVKYQMEAGGFSQIEAKALAKYVNPRVA